MIPFGQLAILSLTDAKQAGFAVAPLYTYNAAKRTQDAWDNEDSQREACEHPPMPHPRPSDDNRLVFAIPQGNLGIQLGEVTNYGALEPLPPEHCPDLGDGLKMLITLAAVIRGEVPYCDVVYTKEGGEPATRRLKPLQMFATKRNGVPRHAWPIAVLCDDIDKGESNKTFLAGRMSLVTLPTPTVPLTDEEAAALPF